MMHGAASQLLVDKAGPSAFRTGLGARLLLGHMPQAVSLK